MTIAIRSSSLFAAAMLVFAAGVSRPAWSVPLDVAQSPLYLATSEAPLNMLVMGKDHKLYYEAYNDASDLNGDGVLDIGYRGWELKTGTVPAGESRYKIDYYGYFNSYVCYTFNTTNNRFEPQSATTDKTCSNQWSGDFLNYLTTGRGDALKRVLYGGDRFVDTDSVTVLQTNYITHDAHSWGKEYQSIARDGYDIARYAPLSAPTLANRYHLFALTSLTNPDPMVADAGAPVLRILENSRYRIWEWVSIEGPVADTRCLHGSTGPNCVGTTTPASPGHPGSYAQFTSMYETAPILGAQFGTDVVRDTINCNSADCNPNGADDDYFTVVTGAFRIADTSNAAGTYQFRIDGDDVVDFELRTNTNWGVAAGAVTNGTFGCYNTAGRGFGGACTSGSRTSGNITLARNTVYYYRMRHEEGTGGDGYLLEWQKTASSQTFTWATFNATSSHGSNVNTGAAARIRPTFKFYNARPPSSDGSVRQADKFVRVVTCPATGTGLREDTCKQYPNGNWKPTGILHDFGETQRMYFGLLTGSQINNLQGGILRRNIEDFANEINANDGTFKTAAGTAGVLDGADGIVGSFRSIRMIGGSGGAGSNWSWGGGTGNCPSIGDRAIVNGECRMWGNPIGEMMFEALRYYAGGAAYSGYTSTPASPHNRGAAEETTMGLTAPAWKDPYLPVASGGLGYRACAKPVITVVSDINPSYDSNLPGNPWNSVTITSPAAISDFDASTVGQAMWDHEFGGTRSVYIGQSGTGTGSSDSAPSAKSASSFGNIRGLSPEEPTKEGTYYSSAVSFYGWTNEQVNARSSEKLRTYSVAVASPLPKIEFPIGSRKLTLLPFAKTVSGTFGGGTQKPTNTIVDFYVQKIVNLPGQPTDVSTNGGRGYALFRINYEDVEQGNDHDMDAIVRYEVMENASGTVTVNLTSEYAAGSANHAIGYTMTGSTQDGIYLEVCDLRDGVANDGTTASCAHQTSYAFNTPPGLNPGACSGASPPAACAGLPPTTTRTFTAGTSESATTLRDPLWYAAKYGGFTDTNENGVPDGTDGAEWDANGDGTPDKYFLVTNALNLRDQLSRAFSQIEADSKPAAGVAASGTRRDVGFLAYIPAYTSQNWTGELSAHFLQGDGSIGIKAWSALDRMPAPSARNMFAVLPDAGGTLDMVEFEKDNLGANDAAVATTLGFTLTELTSSFGATVDDAVAYFRGDDDKEIAQGGKFRDRLFKVSESVNRHSPLGDILNSQPEVLSRGSSGYGGLPEDEGGGVDLADDGDYGDFVRNVKSDRTAVLFVGANDGALHAFNGDFGIEGGTELFAVIPSSSLGRMDDLARPSYTHQYYMDASPTQGDAYISNGASLEWRTILLAGNGAGGRSLLALDVTDPATSFGTENFLWEFSDADLGLTMSRAQVILMQDGKWYAVIGNGVNSNSERAYLYLIPLEDPDNFIKLPAGTATGNGLMSFVAVDGVSLDADGDKTDIPDIKADVIYATDYLGNVWKFDVSSEDSADWAQAGTGPLFTAVDGNGDVQHITGGINVTKHPDKGNMLFFGTGRYFLTGDNEPIVGDPQVQTFYGIWDNTLDVETEVVNPIADRSLLVQQTITDQVSATGFAGRTISDVSVDYGEARGWYLNLQVDGEDADGERFIGEPRVELGRVIFPTFISQGDECAPGGINWLYGLSVVSGSPELTFLNEAGEPDGGCVGCGGIRLTPPGQSTPPAVAPPIVADPGTDPGLDCVPGVDPDCELPEPPCVPGVDPECDLPEDGSAIPGRVCTLNLGVLLAEGLKTFSTVSCGRQSWRQIR